MIPIKTKKNIIKNVSQMREINRNETSIINRNYQRIYNPISRRL